MSRRARQHEQTAAEIVDAAERIVLEGGLQSLTTAHIASSLSLTPGALYRYFPSRDAIIAAVQRRVITSLGERVIAAIDAASEGGPIGGLFAVADALVQFSRESPARYGLLARMLATPEPLVGDAEAAAVIPEAMAVLLRVEALMIEASREGALSPGDERARLLSWWSALHGALQLDKLSRFSPAARAEEILPVSLRALLVGWGASPKSAEIACQRYLWRST